MFFEDILQSNFHFYFESMDFLELPKHLIGFMAFSLIDLQEVLYNFVTSDAIISLYS